MNVLRPSKRRVTPLTDFFVLDTENGERDGDKVKYNFKTNFIFGVIYGHNYQQVFHSKEEIVKALNTDPRFKDKIVFAHNAEYDLTILYGNIYQRFANAIFNGKFICCNNGNCIFADSGNIYVHASVAKIGKMLGMPKHDIVYDHWYDGIHSDHINYCIQDCAIVYEALIRTFEFAGAIKITQASLSMTYFRTFHLKHSIEHNEHTKCFYDSYFGGRTEAFKIGKTNASVIDVNSMYPYTMKSERFPNPKFFKSIINLNVKLFLKKYLPHYEGCIYAKVRHSKKTYGFLPYKKDGKLLFPLGRFEGCWNFNEIRYALEQGAIIIEEITKCVYAPAMESPFIDFVNHLYTARFKTDSELEIDRIKRYMNSLYGKFAQRISEEHIYIEDIEKQYHVIQDHQQKKTFIRFLPFNAERSDGFLVVKTKKVDTSFAIPSFASYITSGARIILLKELYRIEKLKPVYCDTDSIFFEVYDGYYPSSKALGKFKLENKIVTEIRGLKNYKYIENGEEKRRLKGVPLKAINTGENTYEYFNLVKTKESLRRNLEAGERIKRVKEIKGTYTKRIVFADGETKPIEI